MSEWPKTLHRPLYVSMGTISAAGDWHVGDTDRDLAERVAVVPAGLETELADALEEALGYVEYISKENWEKLNAPLLRLGREGVKA